RVPDHLTQRFAHQQASPILNVERHLPNPLSRRGDTRGGKRCFGVSQLAASALPLLPAQPPSPTDVDRHCGPAGRPSSYDRASRKTRLVALVTKVQWLVIV